eukprot:COSAG02_NODE_10994_length_1815_cov_1.544872_1_plen_59_part_00
MRLNTSAELDLINMLDFDNYCAQIEYLVCIRVRHSRIIFIVIDQDLYPDMVTPGIRRW